MFEKKGRRHKQSGEKKEKEGDQKKGQALVISFLFFVCFKVVSAHGQIKEIWGWR